MPALPSYFLGDQSPVPTQDRIRGDDARDLRQDPPAEFVTAHSESTTLGVRQAKRPRAQVFSEDPILLPEIVDQIVLVTVHPASEREDEELQRRRHSLRLLGRLDQHRPNEPSKRRLTWDNGVTAMVSRPCTEPSRWTPFQEPTDRRVPVRHLCRRSALVHNSIEG